MNRTRLIYLLLIASLFAYSLAWFRVPGMPSPFGMSDGGGLL